MCLYLWKITQGVATVSTQFIFPFYCQPRIKLRYPEVDFGAPWACTLSFDHHFKERRVDTQLSELRRCSDEDLQNQTEYISERFFNLWLLYLQRLRNVLSA